MTRKRRSLSLAWRVTALVFIPILISFISLGWLIQRSIENHFAEQDAGELSVIAQSVENALDSTSSASLSSTIDLPSSLQEKLTGAVSGHHGVYFAVFSANGDLLYSTPGPDLRTLVDSLAPAKTVDVDALYTWQEGAQHYRGTLLDSDGGSTLNTSPVTIAVAASTNFHHQFLANFQITLTSIMLLTGLITLAASWLAVQLGHRPLHKISQQISVIRADKLSSRLTPEVVPAELEELVRNFNDMIARMEDVFERLANFSADIAHELRTPITNLTTQTQVALGKTRSAEEYREILYSNLEEYERMAKMVSDMLWLAQTDNGLLKPSFMKLNLKDEVNALFEYFEAWAEENNVSLVLDGDDTSILGDRAMLRRALSNLLTNAVRHSDRHMPVTIRLRNDQNGIHIDVENTGPALDPKILSKLFQRFYRADPARQHHGDGAGLGLAITQSIVTLHGGSIHAHTEESRIIFRISFPR
ncbi:MAG: heavy metal sensor histidine kinase [Gammaproteobacteria bacterium]|nr:heavy metal sensor histidine kinase [Gammaproteobacteria bacterium]MBQ0773792.1 heavy metal sensor histidine kinase [Gammaproteobacteria bacterium]